MFAPLSQLAFTLVELIVGMAVLGIIIGFSVSGFQNFANYQQFDQAVAGVSATLRQAQNDARTADGDAEKGIKILSNSVVTFVGSTYTAGNATNITTTFSAVTLTPALSGGVDEIVFTRLTGAPSAVGTVTIVSTKTGNSAVVEVTTAGVIQ
ncbi:MAG: type II secretion system protein [Patescibacteria group bacterium]